MRCGEAGKITDDPAAERNHAIAARDAELEQPLAQNGENGEALACPPGCTTASPR